MQNCYFLCEKWPLLEIVRLFIRNKYQLTFSLLFQYLKNETILKYKSIISENANIHLMSIKDRFEIILFKLNWYDFINSLDSPLISNQYNLFGSLHFSHPYCGSSNVKTYDKKRTLFLSSRLTDCTSKYLITSLESPIVRSSAVSLFWIRKMIFFHSWEQHVRFSLKNCTNMPIVSDFYDVLKTKG